MTSNQHLVLLRIFSRFSYKRLGLSFKIPTQGFLSRGIVDWSPEIGSILADGELLLQQAASLSGPGLVSILIEVQK